ncbi:MAG: hypothetical protein MUF42_12580 [Cytophagaceae bacterium]|jgi:hypothetical protein|nr:hypothetical protein [Cytophagaceae bacterium]
MANRIKYFFVVCSVLLFVQSLQAASGALVFPPNRPISYRAQAFIEPTHTNVPSASVSPRWKELRHSPKKIRKAHIDLFPINIKKYKNVFWKIGAFTCSAGIFCALGGLLLLSNVSIYLFNLLLFLLLLGAILLLLGAPFLLIGHIIGSGGASAEDDLY